MITSLSVTVSPGQGETFVACVKYLTDDAVDIEDVHAITVRERDAEREYPDYTPYSASMACAALEAARRSGYTGRLAGAYSGHEFVFVALDGRL